MTLVPMDVPRQPLPLSTRLRGLGLPFATSHSAPPLTVMCRGKEFPRLGGGWVSQSIRGYRRPVRRPDSDGEPIVHPPSVKRLSTSKTKIMGVGY